MRALRLPAIFRKITFGSQSLHGAQSLAVNLSLAATAKRQGKDPLGLFKTVLLKADDTPLDTIYDRTVYPKRTPRERAEIRLPITRPVTPEFVLGAAGRLAKRLLLILSLSRKIYLQSAVTSNRLATSILCCFLNLKRPASSMSITRSFQPVKWICYAIKVMIKREWKQPKPRSATDVSHIWLQYT